MFLRRAPATASSVANTATAASASLAALSSSHIPVAPTPLSLNFALSSSFTLTPSRSLHSPRHIRGVGPSPRLPSFYHRPWLRTRLTKAKEKLWSQTHTTNTLDQTVKTTLPDSVQIPSRNLLTGEETGSVTLSSEVFLSPLRSDIVHEVVRWQLACRRQGTHKTKGRAEVVGSRRKIRPQKGQGMARIGDMYAPHHVGGGNAFPRRPHDYSYDLPQPIINMGKRVALSSKLAEGNLYIIDEPVLPSAEYEYFIEVMKKHKWGSFLMVHLDGELDPNLALSCRDDDNYQFLSDRELNVYDLLKAERVVLTRRVLDVIEWQLNRSNHQTSSKGSERGAMKWMVGSFGGGYTKDEIQFIKPGEHVPSDGSLVDGVEVDGARLVIKSGKPYATPIHWP